MARSWATRHKIDRKRWALIRRLVLERDGWRCRSCGKAGRLEIDHVLPVSEGGERYDLRNLQALCRPCHFDKTRAENAARAEPKPDPEAEAWAAMVAALGG